MAASRPLLILTIVLAFAGFLDATYLTAEHYADRIPPCSIVSGCEVVTTSAYSTLGPFPISLFGAGYFLTVAALAILFWQTRRKVLLASAAGISALGFLAAAVLLYVQFFVLHAVCLYCLFSDGTSIILFVLLAVQLKLTYATAND